MRYSKLTGLASRWQCLQPYSKTGIAQACRSVSHIERLDTARRAILTEGDFLDARFGAAQQFIAMGAQRLTALVDRNRGFEFDIALFEAVDNGLELLERVFEAQRGNIGRQYPAVLPTPVSASDSASRSVIPYHDPPRSIYPSHPG